MVLCVFCFFFFSLVSCFVDVRHAYESRHSCSWFFFLYIIFISNHLLEKKKREKKRDTERRTRFLFYSMANVFDPLQRLYVKHVHMYTRDKTLYRCFVNFIFDFFFFFFFVFFSFYNKNIWWLMFRNERELKCIVDFDFCSQLAYVCHHNLSFAYYNYITAL